VAGYEIFLQQMVNGITLGGIYALIALGYTMVYGIIELINFAHGDVFMLGSFIAMTLLTTLGLTNTLNGATLVMALLGVLIATGVLTGFVGVIIERVAYRPLRNAPRLAPLISAIGVSFILQNIVFVWMGPNNIRFPNILPNPTHDFGHVTVTTKEVLIVALSIILMVALHTFVQHTRLGKAMRATAQDREAASLMGIDVNQTIALTFFIGSLLAGAAGIVYGLYYNSVRFDLGYEAGLKAFTAAVLGGIGNIGGAMTGGFMIGIIYALATQYIPNGDAWANAVVFGILILVLVFRPQGLLGQRMAERA
jgi:branched-chain amino acid transport system permease protein